MKVIHRLAARVYSLLLACYPSGFRDEFGEEMNLVFITASEDTRRNGTIHLLMFFVREIRDLPGSIWREHLQLRKGFSMNEMHIKRPDWYFYPAWIGVSVSAFVFTVLLYFLFIGLVTRWIGHTILVNGQAHITEDYLFPYFFLPALFLISGTVQYILLRRYLPRMGSWILATMVGCLLLFVFLGGLTRVIDLASLSSWSNTLVFAAIGGLIGLCQWVVLRGRIPKAGWWILASFLGWGLAILGSHTAVRNGSALAQITTLSLSPAIVGSLAWWFLFKSKTQQENTLSG